MTEHLPHRFTTALVSLTILATGYATSQSAVTTATEPAPRSREAVAQAINAYLATHHAIDQLSGAVLVADEGKVVYRGAFGQANSDWGIPNSVDTKFRLASMTKQFTAMLVLLLVQDGKIALDAKLSAYLPDYVRANGDRVTIRQLLNHTSGIPSYTDRPAFLSNEGKSHFAIDELIAKYCSDPLDFEPGSQFHYNNSGYVLLGAVVEAVTGQTYREALQQRVLQPLRMLDTDLDDHYAVVPGRASGYDDTLGGRRLCLWLDMSVCYAAGGLYSTIGDLWTWDQALRDKQLLRGELEQAMFTPGLATYGFGWNIEAPEPGADGTPATGGPIISHSGGMPGVSTLIWRAPDRGRCVIVLGNSSGTEKHAVQQGIVAILDGREPRPALPRGDFVVARRVLASGIQAGLDELARWPQVVRDEYIERDVTGIGYRLLEQRRVTEAISIFEFLTKAYPKSANTWDSLGEAHLRAGQHKEAVANYEKALALDPKSATVPKILAKLRGR
jgi:CubicO group peptidase (beta-lactamase class C family)